MLLARCLCAPVVFALLAGCARSDDRDLPPPRHYLIDFGGAPEKSPGLHTTGHLLVFNPGPKQATLDILIYFEDREPRHLERLAAPAQTTETNSLDWGMPQGQRFAVEVHSDEPVVCQATIGWTNTGGDYSPGAKASSPRGIRETAKSYMAIRSLAKRMRIADGLVLDGPANLWIRESEWALVLNPGDVSAHVVLSMLGVGWKREYAVDVPARRLRVLYMDDIAPRNQHYGVDFTSDQPVATQWVREVRWYDSSEMMAFWSVPGVPD